MKNIEIFWNASLDELKRGYLERDKKYICLLCNKEIEKGIVYSKSGIFYEAERYMILHIEKTHGSVFEFILEMDKKLTGISEHQKSILRLFYQGKNDEEIRKEINVGSKSTIRNHRFILKEKERQSRLFLALMELLKQKDINAPAIVDIHKTATMVDERYNSTVDESESILKKYFPDGREEKLSRFPKKQKHKIIILRNILSRFSVKDIYTEKEINKILKTAYGDYVTLRRYLIEYGFLDRKPDGSQYWVK